MSLRVGRENPHSDEDVAGVVEYGVDAGELLGELHHDRYEEGTPHSEDVNDTWWRRV